MNAPPRNEFSHRARVAEDEATLNGGFPPNGIICAFHADLQRDDPRRPRFSMIGNRLLDWIHGAAEYDGHDTLALWSHTAETGRAALAVTECMVAHAPPDGLDDCAVWQGPVPANLTLEHIQDWCAVHRPGVIVEPLAFVLGRDWYDVHGAEVMP